VPRVNVVAAVLTVVAAATGAAAEAADLRGPFSVDLTADGRFAVVACRRDLSVAIVDLASPEPYAVRNLKRDDGIPRVPVKVRCFGSTAVLVADFAEQLTVIDVPKARVERKIAVPFYGQDVLWDAKRSLYYVSNRWKDAVLVYDAGFVPVGSIAVGRKPGPMTFGPDGRLYVGNRGTFDVSVVDLDSRRETGRVFIGSRVEDLAATATAVLATNHGGAELPRMHGVPVVMHDRRDIRNIVTSIEPGTLRTKELYENRGADYAGIDVRAGLVAFSGAAGGTVHVLKPGDAEERLETVDLLGDESPLPGRFDGNGARVFTHTRDVAVVSPDRVIAVNFFRDSMIELRRDPASGRFRIHGETALNRSGAPILAVAAEGAPAFTTRQSGDRHLLTLSAWEGKEDRFTCMTCHSEWNTDFRMTFDPRPDPFSRDGRPQGPERNQSLRYLRHLPPFGWEGSVADLAEFNRATVRRHAGLASDAKTSREIAEALVAIEDVLTPGPNPHPPNAAGEALFLGKAGCAECHPAPVYSDLRTHDVGTGRTLDTPTLLGAWDEARLLHDSRAATVADVLDPALYEATGGRPHGNLSALSPAERADLAAFVMSLGDAKTFR